MNEPLQATTNYNLTLMTLFGMLSGIGLTFLFQDVFLTVSLTKTLMIAISASLLWILFYIIKNLQETVVQVKEVLLLMALLFISGGLVWYKLPPLADFSIPTALLLIWPICFAIVYKIEASLMAPEGDVDVFHKGTLQHGTDQRIAFHELPKKQILNEEVAFHIDNDGLDLQIIFNIENTGALNLIKVQQISDEAKFKHYLLKQELTVNELSSAINGAMLIEIQLGDSVAYYQVEENFSYGEPEQLPSINIALLDDSEALNKRIEIALHEMLADYPAEFVKKYNTKNYQAVFKFYDYVKKLNKKENRSIDYISFYHGRFEISNSEYVELYNCNLHSTLISWVNKDGLIRTDYVDEEEELLTPSEKEALQTIVGLPFLQCRLIDIKLLKLSKESPTVKLYLTFAELHDHEPTGKQESLTLSAKGKDILISSEQQEDANLITIDEYFDAKTLIPFVNEEPDSEKSLLETDQQVPMILDLENEALLKAPMILDLESKELVKATDELVFETEEQAPVIVEFENEEPVQAIDELVLETVQQAPIILDLESEELVQATDELAYETAYQAPEIVEFESEELVQAVDELVLETVQQTPKIVEFESEELVQAADELVFEMEEQAPEIVEFESEELVQAEDELVLETVQQAPEIVEFESEGLLQATDGLVLETDQESVVELESEELLLDTQELAKAIEKQDLKIEGLVQDLVGLESEESLLKTER